jgi:hypothetical protein
MEQFNNTPETLPAKDSSFGRVRKWIGPDRPDPVSQGLSGRDITVRVKAVPQLVSRIGSIGSENRSNAK